MDINSMLSIIGAAILIFMFFWMIYGHKSTRPPGYRTRYAGTVDMYQAQVLTSRSSGVAIEEQHRYRVRGQKYTAVLPTKFQDFDEYNCARIVAERGGNDVCDVPFTAADVLEKWKAS